MAPAATHRSERDETGAAAGGNGTVVMTGSSAKPGITEPAMSRRSVQSRHSMRSTSSRSAIERSSMQKNVNASGEPFGPRPIAVSRLRMPSSVWNTPGSSLKPA